MNKTGKTVSLVLGGGGARGYAHVGVLQWLLENGYDVQHVAGTSMGALVGGIHAAGKLELYVRWACALERMEVLRLIDLAFDGSGLIKGERVMRVLRDLVGDLRIEDLPIGYVAVATELESGKEVWLRHGPLFDAIRASTAIPMLFSPVERDGRMLVDGGLVNPVPIAPTLSVTTDLTVAVNLGGRAERRFAVESSVRPVSENDYGRRLRSLVEKLMPSRGAAAALPAVAALPGMVEVGLRSMEAMQASIARLKLAAYAPDVLISIPRNACRIHEFWRAAEMIALGRECAERAFAQRESADLGRDESGSPERD